METIIKPAIKVDVLRGKMGAYVLEHIEDFITPELRDNKDAIRFAREWLEAGVSLSDINARLDVLESESIQRERLKIIEAHDEEVEALMEAEVCRDGFGHETKVGFCPQTLDQMSIADIQELEQSEKETHYNDTYYLHF